MDDDENPPVDVHVEVTPPPAPEPEPEPESAPVVAVVETGGGDAVDAAVVDHTIDHAARISDLERQNAELTAALETALAATANAQATADAAVDIAAGADARVAEAEAGEQAPPEADHTPNHEHAWFRDRRRKRD